MDDTLDIVVLQSPGELDSSIERLDWLERQLRSHEFVGADLLILPELFQCGYRTADSIADVAEPSDGPFSQQVKRLAKMHDIAIVYGYAEKSEKGIYNAAQCIDSHGKAISHHRKLLLPPGFEQSVFIQGTHCNVFKLKEFNLSILICYDIEFPENARRVAAAGAELVIVPTALAAQWGVVAEKLIPTRAFENGVYVAYANHCGRENDMTYFGGSCIVAPNGYDLTRADGDYRALTAKISRQEVGEAQRKLPYLIERLRLPKD